MAAGGFGVDSRRGRRDLRAGCRRHDHLDAPHPLRRQHGRCGALRHADPRADRRSGLQHRICRLSIRSGYAVRHRRQARSRGQRRGEIRCGGSRRGGRRRDLPDVGHLCVRAGRGAGDLHFLRCGEPQRYEDRARGSDRVLDQGHRGADRSACHQAGVLSRGRHRFGRRPEDVRRGVQRRGRHFRLDVGRRRQDRRGAGRRRHEGCRVDGRRYGRASVRRRRCRQRAPDPELEHGAAALRPHGRGFGDPRPDDRRLVETDGEKRCEGCLCGGVRRRLQRNAQKLPQYGGRDAGCRRHGGRCVRRCRRCGSRRRRRTCRELRQYGVRHLERQCRRQQDLGRRRGGRNPGRGCRDGLYQRGRHLLFGRNAQGQHGRHLHGRRGRLGRRRGRELHHRGRQDDRPANYGRLHELHRRHRRLGRRLRDGLHQQTAPFDLRQPSGRRLPLCLCGRRGRQVGRCAHRLEEPRQSDRHGDLQVRHHGRHRRFGRRGCVGRGQCGCGFGSRKPRRGERRAEREVFRSPLRLCRRHRGPAAHRRNAHRQRRYDQLGRRHDRTDGV